MDGRIWKVIGSVLAVAVIGAFGFCAVWTIRNWNTVYQSLDGSSVYTNEDIKRTEQETWEKAAKNEAEYQKTIADLRDLVTSLQVENAAFSDEVAALNISISANESEIRQLTVRKSNLENQVAILQETKNANETVITDLNTKIANLNNRISEMSEMSQNAATRIAALTNRCNELQASINYYESFISMQENGEQAVATYEVDGSVWKIEIVNKGSTITLPVLTNSDVFVFNGWTVSGNDELIGNTYTINSNTKFVADLVRKYSVKFMTDDQVYSSQYVTEDEHVTVPTNPQKDGYDFLGWSLNGIDIVNNIDSVKTTSNITYHAVYVKIHSVTFMNNNQIVAIQHIRNGEYANPNIVTIETDGIFISWQSAGVNINVENYQIYTDTIFTANISYDDWIKLETDGTAYIYPDYIWTDGDDCYCSNYYTHHKLNKSTNTWERVVWNINFNGKYVWSDGANSYYSYNANQYKLNKTANTWETVTWNGLTSFSGDQIWTDGDDCYYSGGSTSTQYKLNKTTNTWETVTWNNLKAPDGSKVWSDGIGCYYSGGSTSTQYKLNKTTNTWERITWKGLTNPDAGYIWTYDNKVYHKFNYVLNLGTDTWTSVTWDSLPDTSNIMLPWSDGENHYIYVNGASQYYVLNTVTNSWEEIIFNAPSSMTAVGYDDTWVYNGDCYYSNGYTHFKLNKNTKTWERTSWNIDLNTKYVWIDGDDYYYSNYLKQYKLNKSTNIWETVTWNGLSSFSGNNVWSDGINCYYSESTNQYKLNRTTNTWEPITWVGLANNKLSVSAIWTDGVDYYKSNTRKLNKLTGEWESITFDGFTYNYSDFGSNVWSDSINCYFSASEMQYKLNKATNTWEPISWTGLENNNFSGNQIGTDGVNYYLRTNDGVYLLAKKVA